MNDSAAEEIEMDQVEDRLDPPSSSINQLVDKVNQLQWELEEERKKRENLQHELANPGPNPSMGRPWMLEWDLRRSHLYEDDDGMDIASKYRNRYLQRMDFVAMQRRKRVMMRAMEAELAWLKREDEAWLKLSSDAAEERERTAQMKERLLQLEAQSAHWDAHQESKEPGVGESEAGAVVVETAADEADRWPTPRLNRVEWKSFMRPDSSGFTLDVLDGEPSIAYVPYYAWGRKASRPIDDNISTAKKKQFAPGQGPMPERIRINSRHIIATLQKLDLKSFEDEQEPLIMVRPFKALVYLEEQIHQIHQALKEKHQIQSDGCQEPSTPQVDGHDGRKDARVSGQQENGADQEGEPSEEREEESSPMAKVLEDPFTSSPVALEQWQVLVEFLNTDLRMKVEWLRSDKCQKVAFSDIWYLFKPGDEVVDQGERQAYRVIGVTSPSHQFISPYRTYGAGSNNSETSPVILFCVHIDFDGKTLGPVLRRFAIPRFDGEKAVTSLRVYPMRFAEARLEEGSSQGSFREKLIARGRQFMDVISFQKHMHYSGLTLDSREQVDGQVVIDFERALETKDRDQSQRAKDDSNDTTDTENEPGVEEEEGDNMTWRPKIGSLLGVDLSHLEARKCYEFCCRQERVFSDQWAEVKRTENYRNSLVPEERWREPSLAIEPRAKDAPSLGRPLGEEDYVIMSYRVFGFILRSRKWAKLNLTHLGYIRRPRGDAKAGDQQQEMAFHQLVLEEGHKNMLLSLVAQHYRDKESPTAGNEQVDIVRGKGKGLIILLHGAPGVGKTTTAEGVAELFEKPLFQITCGDLGSTAEHVECALETNFALANRWGCILLLDEADVFLAKRSPQDFIRNGLVSGKEMPHFWPVFLRVLEYYAGILFLTTNRIGDFDEAFTSRIHISLHYPQLTDKATAEIFQLNIRLIRERFRRKNRRLTIDENEILAYAVDYWQRYETMRWNGRQIRNACQTALALAEFDAGGGNHEEILDPNAEVHLSVTQLKTVAKAYREFMYYLNKLYKTDQDRLAHKRGLRARELHGKEIVTLDEGKGPCGSDEADEGKTHLPSQNMGEQHQSPSMLTSTATVMSPQMGDMGLAAGYPNGLAGNYPSAMPQAQAGYGFFNSMMGSQQQPQQQVPLNPHQNAQMLQNINPALYQQFLVQQSQMQPATGFPGAMQGQPGFMGDGTHHKH
ncbi:hypothetical protein AnigIFM63309_008418 [Aspergillus niger]|nr:hypothetical protein AnigIFM63309_008418 [Aspergillus niger]